MNFISSMFYALLGPNARRLDVRPSMLCLRERENDVFRSVRHAQMPANRSHAFRGGRKLGIPQGPGPSRSAAVRPAWELCCTATIIFWAGWIASASSAADPPHRRPANTFPDIEDTEPLAASHPQLTPDASAAAIELPVGFSVSVFAAEPAVQNPIDLAWDSAGRMWVAENFTYAKTGVRFRDDLRDRVIVFADADHDGTPEQRIVFMDTLTRLTSVEVGPGPGGVHGVWLMCPPQLLFVPDADHDLIPDGPPQVILDGFDIAKQNYHNFANGLRFGDDGWLYGRCGGSCPGRIGAPGTVDEQRVALEGGIWRYDLSHRRFEVICHGTTNPWGHDFNQYGDLFFINTVNGHLWHGIHGAHFNRPFTLDPNPNVFATIDQHADHYHFDTGQHWTKSRDGAANDLGGGHAHCGLMIYQESLWPAAYQGSLMTLNFHGRRANRENLVRRRSGYVATHGKDFFLSSDEWFRGMDLSAGPDGNVFVLDWSDLGECHEHTGVHRSSGRIYKISVDSSVPHRQPEISNDISSLVDLVQGDDRWFSHQAILRLHELSARGTDMSGAIDRLQSLLHEQDNPACRCRLMWTLDTLGALHDYAPWFSDSSEYVRAAAIRSYVQHWPIDDVYGPTADGRAAWPEFADRAQGFVDLMDGLGADASPLIRLNLASSLQRLPVSMRANAAIQLLKFSGSQDIDDHNLPKLIWFGLMDRASTTPDEMIDVLQVCELPELTTYLARSIAEQAESSPHAFAQLQLTALQKHRGQGAVTTDPWWEAMLTGVEQGLIGIRRAPPTDHWSRLREAILASTPDRKSLVDQIDSLYGEGLSTTELQAILDNANADVLERLAAFQGLVAAWQESEHRDVDTAAALAFAARPLISDPHVNMAAAESLARVEHPKVADVLLKNYGRFRAPLRDSVVSLLCAREMFATALIEQIEKGELPKEILSASHVRAIAALGNDALSRRVGAVWGQIRQTSEERLKEITRLSHLLTADRLHGANLQAGRRLFDRNCMNCHKLYGNGNHVGPDLTGAQRGNRDYLLSNIVDPDGVVGADYRATKVLTVDGRLLVGLITQRTRQTLTIASAATTETISLEDVEEEIPTDQSPMPSGLLQPLSDSQIADLIAYLQSPAQIELPAE